MTEFELIERYFRFATPKSPSIALGVGDDCALLHTPSGMQLAVSTDSLVCGVHFPEDAPPSLLGSRALCVAASDLAAMGAAPLAFTLALTLPKADENWLQGFAQGLQQVAECCGLALMGGDTCRGPLHLNLTVFGLLPAGKALKRSGAQAGDLLCVGGSLGDGGGGLAVLQKRSTVSTPRPLAGEGTGEREAHADYLLSRYWSPEPQLALGQWLLGKATAALDISDGLVADCGHLAKASQVRAVIEANRLPLSPALAACFTEETALNCALCAGDDYRLLFSLPPAHLPALQQAFPQTAVIGRMEAGSGVILLDSNGQPRALPRAGWQHFE